MAATTPPPVENEHRWLETDIKSEPKTSTGNAVKSRPAKDAVISGILSSLQTLETPRNGALPNTFTVEDSRSDSLTRPFTATSFASAPNVPFSSSPSMRSNAPVESDDEFDDEFAVGPVVPVMRTASGPIPSKRSSSYGAVNGSPAPLSTSERAQKEGAYNKLSSESWVKGQPDSPETRRLRRVSSHDTLRQVQPDKDFQVDQDFIFNGLGSMAASPQPEMLYTRSSPKTLGKARLYLAEQKDDIQLDDDANSLHSKRSSVGPSTPASRPGRALRTSPIKDSIPLRTSSLRQSSQSPSAWRMPRRPMGRTSSMQRTISEAASDANFRDLGEQDETVKRILELRRKRETRLLDADVISIPDTIDAHDTARETSKSSFDTQHHRPHLFDQTYHSSYSASSAKFNKTNSLTSSTTTPHLNSSDDDLRAAGIGARANNLDEARATAGTSTESQQQQPRTAHVPKITRRPVTAKSNSSIDPPFSLDYSYAQAVDALRLAEQEIQQREASLDKPRHGMITVATLRPTQHRRSTSQSSNNVNPLRPKKQRGRSNITDVSEESSRRRKSMSDARDGDNEKRDSIDDTVLHYLRAPRLSQKVKDAQTGRMISFSEVGDPKGAAVLVCIGMGLTRYVTAFFDELAVTLRLRLITIERPGIGESQAYSDKTGPLMWPGDVTTVCEHLGITHFSMLAHSAGAVYALATALILPNMVRGSIHLLAPWIPPSQLQAASYTTENDLPAGALPRGQKFLRVLPAPFLKVANSSWINMGSLQPAKRKSSHSPNRPLDRRRSSSESPTRCLPIRPATSSGRSHRDEATKVEAPRPEVPRRESLMLMDRFVPDTNPMESFAITGDTVEDQKRRSSLFLSATATPTDPSLAYANQALNAAEHAARERHLDFSTRLTQKTWEFAIKDSNPATDLLICLERHREIGFRYTDVMRRVIITAGAEDKRVPVGNVKWLAEQMNRAALSRAANTTKEDLVRDSGSEPGCEVRILPNEGHGLMASPVIMGDVLTEIAGYWTAEERGRNRRLSNDD